MCRIYAVYLGRTDLFKIIHQKMLSWLALNKSNSTIIIYVFNSRNISQSVKSNSHQFIVKDEVTLLNRNTSYN